MRPNGQPATRRDLAELRTEFKQDLRELKEALQEMIRDSQTEILRAFLPYQESQNVRFRHLELDVANSELALKKRWRSSKSGGRRLRSAS